MRLTRRASSPRGRSLGGAQAPSPRLLPSSPARPAAEKRGEAPRCLTRPDFPGAAPAGDGTRPAYCTSPWGGDGSHPLTAQKERRAPSRLRLARSPRLPLRVTCSIAWRTTFPSVPCGESYLTSAATRPHGFLGV